ncbi:subtilisin-like protease [Epithele typhae]|uniref:subtilisin-like protease n=1 Tax=Epithele typhae TaxID=378194 RepID=UPI002008B1E3|nr:subtilisin-like protease [Epithele typhae]KAH9929600.1 subtilisin-like protease [Epithele typhae]
MALVFLPLLAATGTAIAAQFPLSDITKSTVGFKNTVPNKFIVEVDNANDIPTRRAFDTRSAHEIVYDSLRKRDMSFQVVKEFDSPGLFLGSLLSLEDAAKVLDIPGVKAIRPVTLIPAPKPVKMHIVTGTDDSALPPDTESTHILTNVDKVHAQGFFGKGYGLHQPFPWRCFWPGNKVIGGFDFVGDAYSQSEISGANTPIPDNDPLDTCNGHGTHVAGIIGADPGNPFNISGVAYQASINSYRVFGCEGSVTDDILVEALLLGVQDGNDILTMSLGGADGWTESSSAVVSSRISQMGKIVTIAAGNDGSVGSWYTSSPGNAIDAISVASTDNTVNTLQNATINGIEHDPVTYFSLNPLPVDGARPIFATSNDTTVVDDACNPLPDDTPDLSGSVVLVRRGTCTFVTKLTNIAAKGGNVTLIYDNGNGFSAIAVGDFTAALIQAADGVSLVQAIASGEAITVSFPNSPFTFPVADGGLVSSFTSYGPSNDFFFKPAIAAPGGNILSTFPVALGTFAVLSGTSMATPFMAGVSALLFERVASSHTDGDPLQTLTQQGAGLVDAFKAIHTDVFITPTELITNDTAHFRGSQTFTVKNTGKTKKTFKLTHIPAGTAMTVQPDSIFPADGPVPLDATAASVTISPSTITVLPGSSKTVFFPVFSGFIELASPTGESYQVTYLGLAASLKDMPVVDDTDFFFGVPLPSLVDATGNLSDEPSNFTFVGDDFPSIVMRLNFGTPVFRLDLVDANIQLSTTIPTRDVEDEASHVLSRATFSFPFGGPKGGSFAKVKTLGSLFEADFLPRNSDLNDGTGFNELSFPTPTFANGTTIPNGSYRFLLRVLKVTGDITREEDYESWLSPVIGIQA